MTSINNLRVKEAYIAVMLAPTPVHELQAQLDAKKARLEELRTMPMITDRVILTA